MKAMFLWAYMDDRVCRFLSLMAFLPWIAVKSKLAKVLGSLSGSLLKRNKVCIVSSSFLCYSVSKIKVIAFTVSSEKLFSSEMAAKAAEEKSSFRILQLLSICSNNASLFFATQKCNEMQCKSVTPFGS